MNPSAILANPPFNMKRWGGEQLRPACRSLGAGREDRRWKFGLPPAGNANFAWVQHTRPVSCGGWLRWRWLYEKRG